MDRYDWWDDLTTSTDTLTEEPPKSEGLKHELCVAFRYVEDGEPASMWKIWDTDFTCYEEAWIEYMDRSAYSYHAVVPGLRIEWKLTELVCEDPTCTECYGSAAWDQSPLFPSYE
jgi:hypothetical protein